MFWFNKRRARNIARRIGKAIFLIRDACIGHDLETIRTIVESNNFQSIKVDSSLDGPVAGWVEEQLASADIVYFLRQYQNVNGSILFQVIAEGSGRLAGLQVFADEGDVMVEVSEVLTAMGQLGPDAKRVQSALLEFPGFTSLAHIRARLGM